jgi:VRR-NUC domain-containing protein
MKLTERQWQKEVVRLARYGGWLVFHVYEAKRVVAGWPDLQLLRPPEFVVVELKTADGKLTIDQEDILRRFRACNIETHVWRPSDIRAVRERLAHKLQGKMGNV